MRRLLQLEDEEVARALFGAADAHLKRVSEAFGVRVSARGGVLTLEGRAPAVRRAMCALERMVELASRQQGLDTADTERVLRSVAAMGSEKAAPEPGEWPPGLPARLPLLTGEKEYVTAQTPGQAHYLHELTHRRVVFSIGPAGTGKTYLAVAVAVAQLTAGELRRIVLVRPAVEAGEKLGFLPGDFKEKIHPYLRPLYDALYDLLPPGQVMRYLERGIIEIAPLAYMRGRTLEQSFVILDEAQNTTPGQMKMFLTRLGPGSRAVITGDITQIDLPHPEDSGLLDAREALRGAAGISFVELSERDVVRDPLVQNIVAAYERHEARKGQRPGESSGAAHPPPETAEPS